MSEFFNFFGKNIKPLNEIVIFFPDFQSSLYCQNKTFKEPCFDDFDNYVKLTFF